jgi:hypothetical protein
MSDLFIDFRLRQHKQVPNQQDLRTLLNHDMNPDVETRYIASLLEILALRKIIFIHKIQ